MEEKNYVEKGTEKKAIDAASEKERGKKTNFTAVRYLRIRKQ